MILVDLNQVVISNLMVGVKRQDIDENLIRHMVMNTLRSYKKKFGLKYGELVVCCDNKDYWRRDFFPFYKQNRKKDRMKSAYDWNLIFNSLTTIKEEMKQFLPYKVIDVPKCEADDVIAVLTKKYSKSENILIISSDKDFMQLQRFPNVEQYSPRTKAFLKIQDPQSFIKEHIILGDSGDGIPNIKTKDNVFLDDSSRQKTIRRTSLSEWVLKDKKLWCDDEMLRNYERNSTLIDFENIPDEYVDNIIEAYDNAGMASKSDLMNYFITYKLKNLMQDLSDY